MDIGRLGVWSFQLGAADEAGASEALAELEELDYGAVWYPFGAPATAVKLLSSSKAIVVATGIMPIWMNPAADVAAHVSAMEDAHPGRFLLGLGVSHPEAINRDGGDTYKRPVSSMRSYLDALDEAAGRPMTSRAVLAALGPRMLETAREKASGAHPYFVPVEHTAFAREQLGDGPLLAPEQAVVLETDPSAAREVARGHMSLYLRLQNYTNNLKRFGFTDEDISGGGSDRLVDAIVAWGDAERVAQRIRDHWSAGADHVCIQVIERDFQSVPRAAWREIASALG